MNTALKTFLKYLADGALQVWLQLPSMPPPDNLAIPIWPSSIARLRQLVTEGSPASLVGRMNPGLAPHVSPASSHSTHGQHPPRKRKAPTINTTSSSSTHHHTTDYITPGLPESNKNFRAEIEACPPPNSNASDTGRVFDAQEAYPARTYTRSTTPPHQRHPYRIPR